MSKYEYKHWCGNCQIRIYEQRHYGKILTWQDCPYTCDYAIAMRCSTEPKTEAKGETIDHTISRQAASRCEYWDSESNFCSLHRPSAEQQGQWISQEYMSEIDSFIYTEYKCSNCGEISKKKSKYCPNCGKKMDENVQLAGTIKGEQNE